MKFCYNTNFTLPKQCQRSRSILQDGSRTFGLFWKEKTPSYNRRNMVGLKLARIHTVCKERHPNYIVNPGYLKHWYLKVSHIKEFNMDTIFTLITFQLLLSQTTDISK